MANICEMKDKKPEIIYPNFWEYRVIFTEDDDVPDIVAQAVHGYEYKISPSKLSSSGKYSSFVVSVLVGSDQERVLIFSNLKKHAKFVL